MSELPQRLVYAPKAYVYTKNAKGALHNLTNYVTAGEVNRKLDQVSTATVTLRNPERMFTTHAVHGKASGAAFHPQDPITIYLERIKGHPVRVFTGYLDKTPYYQLYPGTITLAASCTLKRLLYSWFDPSLPYMIAFFEKYGWYNTGKGSLTASQAFNSKQTTTQAAVNAGTQPFTDLQDGSLGKLLWATLYDIGQWQDANIYIEDLPTGPNGIAARMAVLMQSMQQQQQQASAEFTSFLEKVVGTGSQGSGGGNGGAANAGPSWGVVASAESLGGSGCSGAIQADGYSELSFDPVATGAWANNGSSGSPPAGTFKALGDLPCGTRLQITNPANGKSVITKKQDNGSGSTFNGPSSGYPVMGLYPGTVQKLGLGSNPFHVTISRVDGRDMSPMRGRPASVAGAAASAVAGAGAAANSAVNAVGNAISTVTGGATSTASGAAADGDSVSRIQAMTDAAQAIDKSHYPYDYAGGHASAGTPSSKGFDCSGSVAAVLAAAHAGIRFGASVGANGDIINSLQSAGLISPGPGKGNPKVTLWSHGQTGPSAHIFMEINGRFFGTSDGGGQSSGGQWLNDGAPDASSFTPYHYTQSYLSQSVKYKAPKVTGNDSGASTAGGSSGGGGGGGGSNTSAQAFTAVLQLPSIEDQVGAMLLGSEGKGLMHDQQLLPFVQQLAQASLRSFTSLPNGDFYAFYPDYFGEMGTKPVYWVIDDIEILDGGISLSDEGLATHVYAVGDNAWPVTDELVNQLFSAGTITVYNAFLGNLIVDTNSGGKAAPTPSQKSKKAKQGSAASQAAAAALDPGANLSGNIMNADEATKFVERYGARPLIKDYPMVRSSIFEMLLAYQQFMKAWSTQFNTPFTFTFMPEVFPGGKVAFAQHGLQMYVDEVVHQWDYSEGGFTTTATLSAPAIWNDNGSNSDLPPNMIRAMVEPVSATPVTDTSLGGISAQKQKQIAQREASGAGAIVKKAFQGFKNFSW